MVKAKEKITSLLFEIGVEEIPSTYLEGAEKSISEKAPKLLAECGYRTESLEVEATPRRFVMHAANLVRAEERAEEKTGPLKEQAYQNGEPTNALRGFLKSTNKKESDVFFKETPRGACICVKMTRSFKPLAYFFETLPAQIEFPKLMRWEKSRFAFTRPIRWALAFVGKKMQKFTIADVKSGNFSFGHRFLGGRKIIITGSDFEAYQKLLAKHRVILKTEDRVKRIREYLGNACRPDEELISSVANLTEEPFPVRGVFPKEYLKLPPAVLETCMAKQLKIFSCYGADDKITNRFIAIINGKRTDTALIARNYERVLCSRLEDARFFFEEDSKTKLESKVEKLKDMVFLGTLGSYFDKTDRLKNMVQYLGTKAALNYTVVERAKCAAFLAKADLTTRLVYEFPELQGIAGFEYALKDGEEREVAAAVSGHYLPRNLAENFERLKKNLNSEAALLSLSDRMDLLVGAFGLGIEPSGSQDPYGLRRAGGGIVKILRAYPLRISLVEWIQEARKQYGDRISISAEEMLKKLVSFFKERIVFELELKAGTREYELLQAVFSSQFDDIADIYERFNQLVGMIDNALFLNACKVMERTANILKGVKGKVGDEINPALFQDALEGKLNELIQQAGPVIAKLVLEKRQYNDAVKMYGDAFVKPVHEFFEKVKVNADDLQVRANRQAMMKKVYEMIAGHVADLSRITNLA
jgi:glycyl-tRNA synthetase beta chain